jgi:hypothetical protein
MANLSLTVEQYDALVGLSRQALASDPDRSRALEAYIKEIDAQNGIKRYQLHVRWREAGQQPPPSNFPDTWPPTLEASIELKVPIAKSDVDLLLSERAIKPVGVLVTSDPGKLLGWTKIEAWFP